MFRALARTVPTLRSAVAMRYFASQACAGYSVLRLDFPSYGRGYRPYAGRGEEIRCCRSYSCRWFDASSYPFR